MVKYTATTTTTTTAAAAAAAKPARGDDPANFVLGEDEVDEAMIEAAVGAAVAAPKTKRAPQPRRKLTDEERAARAAARARQAAQNQADDKAAKAAHKERAKKREQEFTDRKARINLSAATKIYAFLGSQRVSGAAKRRLVMAGTDKLEALVAEQVRLTAMRGRRTIQVCDAELSVNRAPLARTVF